MRRDVFQAIADPTRRDILDILAGKRLTINQITEYFSMSRPAISKHIRILDECGLLNIAQEGRERYCTANPARLKEVSDWTRRYELFWTKKLTALEKHLNKKIHKNNKGS